MTLTEFDKAIQIASGRMPNFGNFGGSDLDWNREFASQLMLVMNDMVKQQPPQPVNLVCRECSNVLHDPKYLDPDNCCPVCGSCGYRKKIEVPESTEQLAERIADHKSEIMQTTTLNSKVNNEKGRTA